VYFNNLGLSTHLVELPQLPRPTSSAALGKAPLSNVSLSIVLKEDSKSANFSTLTFRGRTLPPHLKDLQLSIEDSQLGIFNKVTISV
jgi:hypothetical protein